MKRIYYLAAVLLILSAPHRITAGTHGGGIKAGLLISDPIAKQDEYDFESINTISLGPFYRYSFAANTALQVELLYARKGAKDSIEIEYLDLISFMQYRLKRFDAQHLDLYAGPVFSMKLDSSDEEIVYASDTYYGTISGIKRNDFGYVIGAKFGIGRGKNEYSVDIRYMSSFMYFNDTSEEVNLKNRTFSIMFEIYFGKG